MFHVKLQNISMRNSCISESVVFLWFCFHFDFISIIYINWSTWKFGQFFSLFLLFWTLSPSLQLHIIQEQTGWSMRYSAFSIVKKKKKYFQIKHLLQVLLENKWSPLVLFLKISLLYSNRFWSSLQHSWRPHDETQTTLELSEIRSVRMTSTVTSLLGS